MGVIGRLFSFRALVHRHSSFCHTYGFTRQTTFTATTRSGGLEDSCYIWAVPIPGAWWVLGAFSVGVEEEGGGRL